MSYRILISGYYGFNNIGDESILLALTRSLRKRFGDSVELTVLSVNPENTAEKFGVRAADRKSIAAIWREIGRCDLLISGGGSLLQDATSNRSILYYLMIIRLALLRGKKVFVYSQGIGPVNAPRNRKRVERTLRRVHGIVVRDTASKELLVSMGLPGERVEVACDPVIGMNAVPLEEGAAILREAGFDNPDGRLTVGFAIRERRAESPFIDELETAIRRLREENGAKIVLIPFFYAEDEAVMEELSRRVGETDVTCIRRKLLTEEMMSLIGNMDVLVGVRLHSLIYAAIMGVPMIGISYDPKINSFMNSVGLKALSSLYDFRAEYLLNEIPRVLAERETIEQTVAENLAALRKSLAKNEDLIETIRNA